MYGISDKLNLSVMLNSISNEITMIRKMGRTKQKTVRHSLGDTTVRFLYGNKNTKKERFISKMGILLPTGSHDLKRDGNLLGYPMQTGTGSYGLSYGFVYTKFLDKSSYGLDFDYLYILGENDEDYQVGNKAELNLWYSYSLLNNLSAHIIFNYIAREPYSSDNDSPMSAPLDDNSQHGTRENIKIGLNTIIEKGWLKDHRFGIDYGQALNRNVKGYQLDIEESLMIGWQKTF
jgi:hypothetical protein